MGMPEEFPTEHDIAALKAIVLSAVMGTIFVGGVVAFFWGVCV